MILALGTFRIRKYTISPDVGVLMEKNTNKPYDEVLQVNGGNWAKAVESLEEVNAKKAGTLIGLHIC